MCISSFCFIACIADGASSYVYAPTQLGSAVVASGLSPDEGLTVFTELQKARKCFVLENELHTVYLVRISKILPFSLSFDIIRLYFETELIKMVVMLMVVHFYVRRFIGYRKTNGSNRKNYTIVGFGV